MTNKVIHIEKFEYTVNNTINDIQYVIWYEDYNKFYMEIIL